MSMDTRRRSGLQRKGQYNHVYSIYIAWRPASGFLRGISGLDISMPLASVPGSQYADQRSSGRLPQRSLLATSCSMETRGLKGLILDRSRRQAVYTLVLVDSIEDCVLNIHAQVKDYPLDRR